MKNISFTYNGSEALEMLKSHFPKTWEQEIVDGQIFLRSLMKMYNLSALDAFQKYIKYTNSNYNGISTFASLHVMISQEKINLRIKDLEAQQLNYGNQLVALEASQIISYQDKKTLRNHYLSKQDELQRNIQELINEYPIIGAKRLIVQTNLFDS